MLCDSPLLVFEIFCLCYHVLAICICEIYTIPRTNHMEMMICVNKNLLLTEIVQLWKTTVNYRATITHLSHQHLISLGFHLSSRGWVGPLEPLKAGNKDLLMYRPPCKVILAHHAT